MKTIKHIVIALVLLTQVIYAQEASVENVLNLKSARNSGVIIENKKIVGYYIFFLKEKKDSKNSVYEVNVFDDNYNPVSDFEIVKSKDVQLVEMVFNGSVFLLHFLDSKGYEFVTYNKSGEKLGNRKIPKKEISMYDLAQVNSNVKSDTENKNIFPNGNQGFIRSTYTKNQKTGYEIVAYDNDLNEQWSIASNPKSDMLEFAQVLEVSGKYIAFLVSKKKNMMTTAVELSFVLAETETGKKIKEIENNKQSKKNRSLSRVFINELDNTILLLGEYFKPGDNVVVDRSVGIYLQQLNTNGEEISEKEYRWKEDIQKKMPKKNSQDKEDKTDYYIYVHDIVYTKNGNLFLVGEQYAKKVSASGVAFKALGAVSGGGSNVSAFEVLLGDMVLLEIGKDKELVSFKTIEKKHHAINLPNGAGLYGTSLLGLFIKAQGDFDYSFTSRNIEKDQFDIVYTDAERKESKESKNKADLMIGAISIRNGVVSENRVPINCESSRWWIQAGKPGYISITEYYRKEKRLDSRLESISF
jgi:hypothetical protein